MLGFTYKACHCSKYNFSKHFMRKLAESPNSFRLIYCDVKRPTFNKFIRKPSEQSAVVLSHSTLITLLKNCNSFAEQIQVFQSYVKLTDEDISRRISLCNNIEKIFKTQFPDCAVHLVGSSISGLGLKGSDVDLSFQFSATDDKQNRAAKTSIITNVDVVRGKISMSDLPSLTVKQQLLFLLRIIKQHEAIISPTIIPGHHPILNFKFNDLGCDLSINNWSAFQSTKLMKLCAEMDCRVLILFQLLSYWGKRFKLIGGPMKFKSYSLFLMVVYFLQTRNNPILPTIQDLFIQSDFLQNQNNWCYDISQHLEKIPQSNNVTDLETLFREFFFFYSNFDFSPIMCTLNAKLIDVKSYVSEHPEFELNTISIQDPLNCSQNVTTGVNWKYSKRLIKYLFSTCEVYHKSSQLLTGEKKWGLTSILDAPQHIDCSSESNRIVEIEIPLKKDAFFQNSDACCHNTASEKVYNILKKGLIFQCNCLERGTALPKISETGDVTFKNQCKDGLYKGVTVKEKVFEQDSEKILISRILCTTSDTWTGRSNYFSQNVQCEEDIFLDYEHEISKKILENKMVKDKEDFHFLCECYGTYKENVPYLYINMVSISEKTFTSKLRIFLKEYILNYSRIYL